MGSILQEQALQLTKTPTQAGQQNQQSLPKFKKIRKPSYLKDPAAIYADLGAKQQRQEALASQIRMQH